MKILMVCLGNICRSPMAEGILKAKCRENNLDWLIESAGTESYHVGRHADERAIRTATHNGIDISNHIARQFNNKDFKHFDIIYAMAVDVFHEIESLAKLPGDLKNVRLFLHELYPGENRSVPDPWYGNEQGFQPVHELIDTICEAIIVKVKNGTY